MMYIYVIIIIIVIIIMMIIIIIMMIIIIYNHPTNYPLVQHVTLLPSSKVSGKNKI